MPKGTVTFFHADEGWGAIRSGALPRGHDVWVHFCVLEMDGYRCLNEGQAVDFEYERADQDGFEYRATWARPQPAAPSST